MGRGVAASSHAHFGSFLRTHCEERNSVKPHETHLTLMESVVLDDARFLIRGVYFIAPL